MKTNKPHHGIINNGVLTWVNEPKAVAMVVKIAPMIAGDLQKQREADSIRNEEIFKRSLRKIGQMASHETSKPKKLRKRRKDGAYWNWKHNEGYRKTRDFLRSKYPYKF